MTLPSFTSGAELFVMDKERETLEWVGVRNRKPFPMCFNSNPRWTFSYSTFLNTCVSISLLIIPPNLSLSL